MKVCKECNEVEITGIKKRCPECAYKRKLAKMNASNRRVKKDKGAEMVRPHEYFTPERRAKLLAAGYMSPDGGDDGWIEG